ncbi:MAG: hypothetical protein Q4C22_04765 [Bacillota bacterium]|nr:hypothetical protein [Bacillota bacterium]
MKRIGAVVLALLLAMGLLAGCGNRDKHEIQEEFLLMLVEKVSTGGLQAAETYLDENLSSVRETVADHMLVAFADYLYRYISTNPDKIDVNAWAVYYDEEEDCIDEEAITLSQDYQLYETLTDCHIMLRGSREALSMQIDYTRLLEDFGEYLSPELTELYQLNARAMEEPMTENATLMVSWEEVLDRAAAAERLLTESGDHQHIRDDALWLYKTYISTLLMGATNTPIFNYESGAFSEEARQAYRDYMAAEPELVLTEILRQYFEYLGSIDYTMHYSDETESKQFFETCDYLLLEAEKRVTSTDE